jgi:ATP-binding cassette, subfamily F, member 3
MITLRQLSLRRGSKLLLDTTNLCVHRTQKVGVIGTNGTGKTSLFALIRGELEAEMGEIDLPANLQLAHVQQEMPITTQPIREYVIDGNTQYRLLEKNMARAEADHDAIKLASLYDQLALMGGYQIHAQAEKILRGLGFKLKDMTKPVIEFSGGWRMRLNLAQALMSPSDLLLLDEPTNHLDLDAIIWLEQWLNNYQGTLLVISHDREFLDNTTTHILHFERQQLKLYQGNYSAFEKQLAESLANQQATYEKQQQHIKHLQSFIDRFRAKASKAHQAQSRIKALQRMEMTAAVQTTSPMQFHFKEPRQCPNPLLVLENVAVSYQKDQPILMNINLQIAPGDRIGLLGQNGAGKSTLIKLIAGKLTPLSGYFDNYEGLKIGYFAQHQLEHLDLQASALELLQKIAPGQAEQPLRNFLGSFNFSGDMALTPIATFSGGEKARLALALIIWQAPNLLLLDEPTNHLDMDVREALILALQEFSGAMIVVSHDRHLLRTTTDDLLLVAQGNVKPFQGDLDDYKVLLLQSLTLDDNKSEAKKFKVNTGKERRKLETQLATLEKEIKKLQQQKVSLENILADKALHEQQNHVQIQRHIQQREQIILRLEETERLWFQRLTQLEKI